jgi:phosphoglycolate phosphatase
VLFDVDGTLFLTHDPLFEDALIAAADDVYDLQLTQACLDRTDHPGQTSLKIAREVLHDAGLDDAAIDPRLAECCAAISTRYLALVDAADTSGWEAAPGAAETLEELTAHARIVLLTGNPEPVARARMDRLGLGRFFPEGEGAFGCEAEHRIDLIALARKRAGNHSAAHTWAVGDTPTDVSSADAAGIHCVGVASGRFHPEELAGADAVVEDLSGLLRVLP